MLSTQSSVGRSFRACNISARTILYPSKSRIGPATCRRARFLQTSCGRLLGSSRVSTPHSRRYISSSLNTDTDTTTSTNTVFADPHRPGLFYHLVPGPTPISATRPAFALSFLAEPPRAPEAPSVIGWLPAQAEEADPPGGGGQTAALRDFRENGAFLLIVHETIAQALRDGADADWVAAATARQAGWMHIQDQRNVPALDRIGDPDDIIASVLVRDGAVLPETYAPMPAYRVCTADGVLQLTEGLAACLQRRLVEDNRAQS
ncbi:hypothetical protein HYPSUDRAFT_134711 [Hypholoma sublateritium FD-334 SS-4]|uniref:Uncharacterized protein n=1 Tax=Hypholoma sublateritium (strain FD-334 SS-4) TaxID=945553 RepID=A0A0D2LDE7_HYPSF|nr:hypothetical protein HYPSUDRAFT_134711 [Hypholoma sublateritium FD-334 SS-4]